MTNKLVAIINSLKVPIKKILLHEMKFLVPNYSCLQNPWLGGYAPRFPFSLCSVLDWICWTPPRKKFLDTPLHHTLFVRFLILTFSLISPFYFISYCLHMYIHIKFFLHKNMNINISSFYDPGNGGIGAWFPVVLRDFSSSPKYPDWLWGPIFLPVNGH